MKQQTKLFSYDHVFINFTEVTLRPSLPSFFPSPPLSPAYAHLLTEPIYKIW